MSHTQFTHSERISLATLLRAGHTKADCARELAKDRSAVGREIDLNKDEDGVYRAGHAHKRAMVRRKQAKKAARKITNNRRLRRCIVRKLKKHWSPEQIAGRLRYVNGETTISHETIYLWIYSERAKLKKYLRSKKDKYRRKRGTKAREDKREEVKVKRIDERPRAVDLRTRIGDWGGRHSDWW